MKAPLVVSMALALLASGCAARMKTDKTVCPEYRGLMCATAAECSMDYGRGCQVCQCQPSAADQSGQLPSGVRPDQR